MIYWKSWACWKGADDARLFSQLISCHGGNSTVLTVASEVLKASRTDAPIFKMWYICRLLLPTLLLPFKKGKQDTCTFSQVLPIPSSLWHDVCWAETLCTAFDLTTGLSSASPLVRDIMASHLTLLCICIFAVWHEGGFVLLCMTAAGHWLHCMGRGVACWLAAIDPALTHLDPRPTNTYIDTRILDRFCSSIVQSNTATYVCKCKPELPFIFPYSSTLLFRRSGDAGKTNLEWGEDRI